MSEFEIYRESCDASAAAGIEPGTLFITASDEDYVLRVYDSAAPGAPVFRFDVRSYLHPADPGKEPDIEGAARIESRVYWVTSHGADKNGMHQESRHRFFATDLAFSNGSIEIRPVGRPYTNLLRDLAGAPDLARFDLARAAARAPEAAGGLNIEGLAPSLDGGLLIAFRNPIPDGRALVVRLGNAAGLLDGTAARAELSLGALIDLDGRGIRALDLLAELRTYLIIAGAPDDDRRFQLFRWTGSSDARPEPMPGVLPEALNPEELLLAPSADGRIVVRVLSDDGDEDVGGKRCKKLRKTPEKQSFRAARLKIAITCSELHPEGDL